MDVLDSARQIWRVIVGEEATPLSLALAVCVIGLTWANRAMAKAHSAHILDLRRQIKYFEETNRRYLDRILAMTKTDEKKDT